MDQSWESSIQVNYSQKKPLRLRTLLTRSRNGNKFLNLGIQKIATQLLSLQLDYPLRMKDIADLIHKRFKKEYPDKLFSDKTIQKRLYDAVLVLKQMRVVYLQKRKLRILPEKVEGLSNLVEKVNELAKKKHFLQQKKQQYKKLRCVQKLLNNLKKRNEKNPDNSESKIDIANLVGMIMKKQNSASTKMQLDSESDPIKLQFQIYEQEQESEQKENLPWNEIYNQSEEDDKHYKVFNLRWIRKPNINLGVNDGYTFNNCQKIMSNIELICLLFQGNNKL